MTWKVIYEDCIESIKDLSYHYNDKDIPRYDMVFADPPFGIDFDRRSDDTYSRKNNRRVDGYKEIRTEDYLDFTDAWMKEVDKVTKKEATIYIVSGWTNLLDVLFVAENLGWFMMNHIIWQYSNPLPTKKKYRSAHYHIPVFLKSKTVFKETKHTFNFDGNQPYGDVWYVKRDMRVKKHYLPNATKLPNEIVERAILTSSNEGDWVLDPFVGNGTTPAMCVRHNRNFLGYEVNKNAKKTIDYIVGKEEHGVKSRKELENYFG